MKKIVILLTALLLVIGLSYPAGTEQADAAAAPVYTEISTFIDGKLIISASKSVLVNGASYVPVKLLNQIPGLTIASAASGVTITGTTGSAKLNKDNSVLYKNSNYVNFKTLLKLGTIDGKYASSAVSLFMWSTEEGKTKSNNMLYAISKLPGTMGQAIGKKVYMYGHPGSHWVTDVQYIDETTQTLTMQNEAGTVWTLDLTNYEDNTMYTAETLQLLKDVINGHAVWARNSEISNSPFKNMEKASVKDFRSNPNSGNLEIIIRRANGQEVNMNIPPSANPAEYVTGLFYIENPRNAISDKVWAAIREERVIVGMKPEEVFLSWGTPDSINEDLAYVVYGNVYLYFINNKVYYIYKM
ncbi:hypothetical protein [Paenibacillus monticola]|uniref:Copper amine oxidase-like N-terminal domain-containing protein n=1 Tax=Paenibacillus monticola TaxID=2666075 RepID=A0A7X2L309_9BACL|nr:hypothetical protein [Paenibacillus monticola]MRN54969.1 hypothetical protein [Paenibacillus monticola]